MNKHQIDFAAFKRVTQRSEGIEIEGIHLAESSCQRQNIQAGEPTNISQTVRVGCKPGQRERLFVAVDFSLEAVPRDKKTKPLKIAAKFVVVYKISGIGKLQERDVTSFANGTAVFHSWPYWREFVQTTTARMGLPPLTLPLLKMGLLPDGPKKPMARRKKVVRK